MIVDAALCIAFGALAGAAFGLELGVLAGLVASFLYFGWCEGAFGQTLGKRLTLIRVADADDGRPIGLRRALLRHLGRLGSYAVLGVGLVWMIDDKQHQTWHDKLVGSVVRGRAGRRDDVLAPR